MFYFWIRKQFRKVMEPMPVEKAQFYSNFFTFAYLFSGWTLFGMTCYFIFGDKKKNVPLIATEEGGSVPNSGYYYGKIFRAENMQIYSVQGFSLKKDGEYRYGDDAKAQEEATKADIEFYGDNILPRK